jgi:hypothetical protein
MIDDEREALSTTLDSSQLSDADIGHPALDGALARSFARPGPITC